MMMIMTIMMMMIMMYDDDEDDNGIILIIYYLTLDRLSLLMIAFILGHLIHSYIHRPTPIDLW